MARGLSLRSARLGISGHQYAGELPHPHRLQAEEAHPDGRLEPERIQPDPVPVRAQLLAHERARQPDLPPIHREPGRAWRAHVLRTDMKTAFKLLLASMAMALAAPAIAVNVFACEPEWAALAQELGG